MKKRIEFDTLLDLIERGSGKLKLQRTDPMKDIEDFDPYFLVPLYSSKDKVKTIYATVLKAAFLQRRSCFLLSRNELHRLVRLDEDNRYKSVNEKDYIEFFTTIVANDVIKYVIEPSDLPGIAALVTFADPILQGLFELETPEFYEIQKSKALEIYKKRLEKIEKEEERKLKQKQLREQKKNNRLKQETR